MGECAQNLIMLSHANRLVDPENLIIPVRNLSSYHVHTEAN